MTSTRVLALAVFALSQLVGPPHARAQPVPVGPEFQVNTYTTDVQNEPAVGADGLGNFVRYCAQFGGDVSRNDGTLTKRRNAPAPGACP